MVYAQLPESGERVEAGGECGALESVKAASELISPVTGVVQGKNEAVEKAPALVMEGGTLSVANLRNCSYLLQINSSPMDEGWLFKVLLEKEDEETAKLMTQEQYDKYLKAQDEDSQ